MGEVIALSRFSSVIGDKITVSTEKKRKRKKKKQTIALFVYR